MYLCSICIIFWVVMLGKAFRFHTPSSILVVGPSGCGKTVFTEKLVLDNHDLFDHHTLVPVHYCYGAWQDRLQTMKDRGVHFHEGIPDTSALVQWFPRRRGGILVLDDLMDEGSNDKRVLDLFTKHSHHQNVTVLYLCQDMFPVGKYAKSISRNAHYIVAFKNPRDQLGVRNVLLQSFPTTWKDSLETFHRATTRPYGYLVLDLHPASPGPPTIVEPPLQRQRMDALLSKATQWTQRRRRGCSVQKDKENEDGEVDGYVNVPRPCFGSVSKTLQQVISGPRWMPIAWIGARCTSCIN